MNAFQRRNFKLDDPIEQGISCYEQDENGQRGQFNREPTAALERKNILQSLNFRFLNPFGTSGLTTTIF